MQSLYHIATLIIGKDLEEEFTLEYVLAGSDQDVFDHINLKHTYQGWSDGDSSMSPEEILEAGGDFDADYAGEFYDQKYGWELKADVSESDIEVLQRLGLLVELLRPQASTEE